MKICKKHQTVEAIRVKELHEDVKRIKKRYKLFLSKASKVQTQ